MDELEKRDGIVAGLGKENETLRVRVPVCVCVCVCVCVRILHKFGLVRVK